MLGPGLMDKDSAHELVRRVLPRLDGTPVLLDGLALTGLAGHEALVRDASALLTPNAGELAALLDGEELEGEAAAVRVAERYGAVVSSPGWVAAPDGRTWCVEAGGIGLGTSGSGDVLAGLVGGVLARGAEPEQAAAWGQYLHSAAGDLLTSRRRPGRLPGPRAARRGAGRARPAASLITGQEPVRGGSARGTAPA